MVDRLQRRAKIYLPIVLAILVLLFPVYWMLVSSVLPTRIVYSSQPPLIPPLGEVTADAYASAFSARPLARWLFNSATIAGGAIALSSIVSILAGYSLSRLGGRVQTGLGFSLFALKLIPGTLLVIPLFLLYHSLGLFNTRLGLILANAAAIVPFVTWMLKNYFDTIPLEVEEAGLVDGCSRLGVLWRIVLPLSKPGIAAAAIYAGILAWGDYVFARTLTQGDGLATVTVGMTSFIGEFTVDWSALLAAGLVVILPVIILFVFVEPFLRTGLTGGSGK